MRCERRIGKDPKVCIAVNWMTDWNPGSSLDAHANSMQQELPILNPSRLFELIKDDLDLLDRELERVLETEHAYLNALNHYVLDNPGKRLRPALLFLCSRMLGHGGPNAVTGAAVFELIHAATLIHDDVIDGASKRRGRATLNQGEGDTITVLFGDLLFAKANTLAVSLDSLEIMETICLASSHMIEGELLQERWNYDLELPEETYFRILMGKTAYLFAGTVKTAAILAGCSPELCESIYQYGLNLGISYQLIDDYLDYVGDENLLGKPVLSDLKAGKLTLPTIRLLAKDRRGVGAKIQTLWNGGDAKIVEELRDQLQSGPELEETWNLGREYALKGVAHLKGCPNNIYTRMLTEFPLQVLDRER